MIINKVADNDILKVSISGRVDTTTSSELECELKDNSGGFEQLVLDFKDVNYISSAGLRVLLSVNKIMILKGGMKLVNVNEDVMEIFDITGFSDILDIE